MFIVQLKHLIATEHNSINLKIKLKIRAQCEIKTSLVLARLEKAFKWSGTQSGNLDNQQVVLTGYLDK